MVNCTECKEKLLNNEKGKTWDELIDGFPAHFTCEKKFYKDVKILKKKDVFEEL